MIEIEKIKAICVIFANNMDDLFVTKLMKLFYYLDFISYHERGASVSNDTYFKLPYGPVPSFVKNEIDNLNSPFFESQLSDVLIVEEKSLSSGKKGCLLKVKPKAKLNLSLLSDYEVNLLNRLIKSFKSKTASELSDMSHREPPYLLSDNNSVINYGLADQLNISEILK